MQGVLDAFHWWWLYTAQQQDVFRLISVLLLSVLTGWGASLLLAVCPAAAVGVARSPAHLQCRTSRQ